MTDCVDVDLPASPQAGIDWILDYIWGARYREDPDFVVGEGSDC